jgi:hypothetical protein
VTSNHLDREAGWHELINVEQDVKLRSAYLGFPGRTRFTSVLGSKSIGLYIVKIAVILRFVTDSPVASFFTVKLTVKKVNCKKLTVIFTFQYGFPRILLLLTIIILILGSLPKVE